MIKKLAKKIRDLKIQSNTTVALKALEALKTRARNKGFSKKFWNDAKRLEEARPSEIALFNCLSILRRNPSLLTIDSLLDYFPEAEKAITEQARELFKKPVTVLTHCHSTSVVSTLKKYKRNVKKVYVTETRPLFQGKETAKELDKAGLKVVYAVDSAAGLLLPDTDLVLLGADALSYPGVYNKIGSYTIALASKPDNTPVYISSALMKLDFEGRAELEERPAKEVGKVPGKVLNPAFDLTPWPLVKGVITEQGILNEKGIVKRLNEGVECILT